MPKHRVIHIKGIDPNDKRKLILDKPNLKARSLDSVQWVILGNSGVDSIVDITDKEGYNDVWTTRPIGKNNLRGEIKKLKKKYTYEYNIVWTKDGVTYTHDPKIAINPTPTPTSYNLLIALVTFLGIFSIFYLVNSKIRK
jgi:hypothetical protein